MIESLLGLRPREGAMRRITGVFLVTVLLAACVSPPASQSGKPAGGALARGWITFTPPDGSFSISLPSRPAARTRSVNLGEDVVIMSSWLAESADGKTLYGVSYADYAASVVSGTDHQAILDGAVDGFITATEGALIQSHSIYMGGIPGRDLTATVRELEVHGHIYLNGRRLFQVTIFSDTPDMPNGDAFLDSFLILP